ncbi:MAG: superoxide dismutase family protein [Candidatus Goldiibacteriota bacterium]
MIKKIFYAPAVLMVLAVFAAGCSGSSEKAAAAADLVKADGSFAGSVKFEETNEGVRIKAEIRNMTPGSHAIHIHENGSCAGDGFADAGGHFNPYDKKHGFLAKNGPHAGDLPNINIKPDGTASYEVINQRVTLEKGKKNSLLKKGGTSIIIHEGPDDYYTQPAGGGGKKAACGVIRKTDMNRAKTEDIRMLRNRLKEMEKEIKKIEKKITDAREGEKQELEKNTADLRRQFDRLSERAGEIMNKSGKAFDEAAGEFKKQISELGRKIENSMKDAGIQE